MDRDVKSDVEAVLMIAIEHSLRSRYPSSLCTNELKAPTDSQPQSTHIR